MINSHVGEFHLQVWGSGGGGIGRGDRKGVIGMGG